MVASVVEEETLGVEDVMRILDEASQLRAYSRALEEQSRSLREASAELRAANEQLKSLDRLKDDFMSSVTHELRTPLTSIRALAELMLDEPRHGRGAAPPVHDHRRRRDRAPGRLVNQVLDMAKIESGHAEWRSTEIDLRELLEQAALTTRELFRERGAEVRLHLPDAVPPLRADRDRLLQVVLNLLSNAAKFVPRRGRPGRRAPGPRRARPAASRSRTTAPACRPSQQQLVFEKFRQGGDALDRPQGTGLGLPISRRIVEHFGGRMWLHSAPGAGACFGFELPWHHDEQETQAWPQGPDRRRRAEHPHLARVPDEARGPRGAARARRRRGAGRRSAASGPTWCCST